MAVLTPLSHTDGHWLMTSREYDVTTRYDDVDEVGLDSVCGSDWCGGGVLFTLLLHHCCTTSSTCTRVTTLDCHTRLTQHSYLHLNITFMWFENSLFRVMHKRGDRKCQKPQQNVSSKQTLSDSEATEQYQR